MKLSIDYRRARRGDIAEMARIWSATKSEGGATEERMTAYFDGRHNPQHALQSRIVYVALEGPALVGYVAGHLTRRHACDGELQWIYVVPERRRCGVASGLWRQLADWFCGQQVSRVCVNVDPKNQVARSFYVRSGAWPLNAHWMVWDPIERIC